MPPKPNNVPHYIIAKEIPGEGPRAFQDLSTYVSSVTFTADMGSFPSTQLDIIPLPGVGMADGKLYLPSDDGLFAVTRNDRILVMEVDEENYNYFVASGDKAREIKNGVVVMWGVVADMMTGKSATRNVISLVLESELAYLDTTLTQEMLGSRGAGMTCGSIIGKDIKYEDVIADRAVSSAGVTEARIIETFVGKFELDAKLVIDQTHGDFTKLRHGLQDLKVGGTLKNIVEEGEKGRVRVYPWPLVRLVTAHCIAHMIPANETAAAQYGVEVEAVRERADKIIKLMCLIEAQAGEDQNTFITLSRNEYASFVRTTIIKPLVTAPSDAPSFWNLINSILNQLHFYFTPKVLYRSEMAPGKNLGSFQMMNPYRDYTAIFREGDLEFVENKVPGYKSIIKSIGFKARVDIPTFIVDPAPELTRTLYQIYYPRMDVNGNPADYLLYKNNPGLAAEIADLGRVPDYAYHKEIAFPKWLPDVIESVESLYQETITKKGQTSEQVSAAMKKAKEAAKGDLKSVGDTVTSFIKSALMIYGRINVTSTVGFIRLWPDCFNPLKVMLLDLGERQQTTGLISRVTVKWVQGKSYNITVNLSHVTDLRDSYYRPLFGDLGITASDNLETYTSNLP